MYSFWYFLCAENKHINHYSADEKLWFICQRCGKNLKTKEE